MPTTSASQYTELRRYSAAAAGSVGSAPKKGGGTSAGSYSITILSASSPAVFLPSVDKVLQAAAPIPLPSIDERRITKLREFFLSTGLSNPQITTLWRYLNPSDAVVFGSATLYAWKEVSELNGVPVNDIDILFSVNSTVLAQVQAFLVQAGFVYSEPINNISLQDTFSMIPENWILHSSSKYVSGNTNPITFIRSSNFNSRIYKSSEIAGGSYNAKTYRKGNGTRIQLVAASVPTYQGYYLTQMVADTADLTVAAGTFDGSILEMPYITDVNTMTTTYRDPIGSNHRIDWMIYRLQKWISRGFFVYFNSQTQINAWNSNMTGTSENADSWMTSVQESSQREALGNAGYCPFPTKDGARVAKMRELFATTGLTDAQITQMWKFLGPTTAVVFGSAPLYAWKNVSQLNGIPIHDIDIYFKENSETYNIVKTFLENAGFSTGPTVEIPNGIGYVPASLMDKTWTLETSSNYTGGNTNPLTFGTFVSEYGFAPSRIGKDTDTTGYTALNYQKNGGTRFQLVHENAPTSISDLREIVKGNGGDFTVASGHFDGTSVIMPYSTDADRMITTYRDKVSIANPDWMIYRLQKWISRGFFVYFKNQTQINDWNVNGDNFYDDLETADYWITSVKDIEQRKKIAKTGCCPFPLRLR